MKALLIQNSSAHLAARVVSLAAGLVAIPLVTMTLGMEALGLLGVYATLQGMLGLFDLGLPIAVNHQLAVLIGRKASSSSQASLIRSLEILFWAMAAIFVSVGFLTAGPLATSWLKINVLPREIVLTSLILIIWSVAIRFPVAFYSNVLFGLGRHIYPNVVITLSAVLRTAIAIVALVYLEVGLVGFFVIQLIAGLAEVGLMALGVWYGAAHWAIRPKFTQLREVRRMAGLLTAVSLTGVGLTQIDKIILSKIISLGDFGLYSAAYTLAAGLLALSYPVSNAIFPQLSQFFDQRRWDAAARLIRLGSELTILLVVPLGAVITTQPEPALEVLFLGRPFPAELVTILPWMLLGGIAQAFVTMPHMFRVASGQPEAVLWINGILLIPYGILILVLANYYGVWGAAVAFAIFNIARLSVHWIGLLANQPTAFAWRSSILQAIATNLLSFGLAWCVTLLWSASKPTKIMLAALTVAGLFSLAAIILPSPRRHIISRLRGAASLFFR